MRSSGRQALRRSSSLAILAWLTCATFAASGESASGADGADRVSIEQFVQRTLDYVSLRNRAVAGRPPLKETASPAEIGAREASPTS